MSFWTSHLSTELISIRLPQSTNIDARSIGAIGIYPDGVHRSLRGTLTGTTYTSNDVNVATVDASGVVNAVAPGRTFVTIQSGTANGFVEVRVKDPNSPILPIAEQTTSVTINAGGFRIDPETGEVVQRLLIQNTSPFPLSGPLVLLVTDLPQNVLVSNAPTTKTILPAGTPYVDVEVPLDSAGRRHWFMLPGLTTTATLVFRNPQGIPITYTPRLYTAERP